MALLLIVLLTGCAKYDFVIVEPEALKQRISEEPVRIETANLTYHMQARTNALVIQVFNPSAQPIQLLGERSHVVDAYGYSRPINSAVIGANAYAQFMLPPAQPYYTVYRPYWGHGYYADPYPYGYPVYGRPFPHYYSPTIYRGGYYHDVEYIEYSDPNDPANWVWKGDTSARLSLTYQREDNSTFREEFTIRKVKR